jgi:membrane associated rhomboid family serine protease
MFFPLGLGFKVPRLAWVTLLLITANIFVYFSRIDNQRQILEIHNRSEMVKATKAVFVEYCQDQFSLTICKYLGNNISETDRQKGEESFDDFSELVDEDELNFKTLIKMTNLVNSFKYDLKNHPNQFEKYLSYSKYLKAKASLVKELQDFYEQKKLLSKHHISPFSIMKAQFNHATFFHLFFNMFALFVFGIYVENRIGSGQFLLMYLLGGTISMGLTASLFLNEYTHLLGASGNIYTVMGLFMTLFYHHRIKFLFFYFFFKIIYLPIKWTMPLLYIFAELANSMIQNNIAHEAHLIGILAGSVMGYYIQRGTPVKYPFLYPKEMDDFNNTLIPNVARAKKWLEYNPNNPIYREILINDTLSDLNEDYQILTRNTLQDHLPELLRYHTLDKNFPKALEVLSKLPFALPEKWYLTKVPPKKLIGMADHALDNNDHIMAIKLYSAYADLYPNSKIVPQLLKTTEAILDRHQDKNFYKAMEKIIETSNNVISNLIYQRTEDYYYHAAKEEEDGEF